MRWWLRLFGGLDNYPDPPERLIDIPEIREPSADLLRRLRTLDSRAEVVYLGNGVWLVGRVKTESHRRIEARSEILSLRVEDGFPDTERLPELRQAILKEQGFGQVVRTDGEDGNPNRIYGEPDAILFREFEKAMCFERAGYKNETDEDKIARARLSRQRAQAQRDKDLTKEAYFRGRGNFHFAARSANTGR